MMNVNQISKKGMAFVTTIIISITMLFANYNSNNDIVAAAYGPELPTIATLTIFSDVSDGSWRGRHTFLYIYNKSSSSLDILGYTLNRGKGMTIGTWGNKDSGKGIYINLEAYYINNYNSYSDRLSLTMDLNQTKFDKLITKMNNNNKWSKINNCSCFATKCWNSVCVKSKKISVDSPSTPRKVYDVIDKHDKKTKNKAIKSCITSKNYVYRYKNGALYKCDPEKNKDKSSSSSLEWSGMIAV